MAGRRKIVAGGGEEGQTWGMPRRLNLQDVVPGGLRGEGEGDSCTDSQVSSFGGGWAGLILSEAGDTRATSWFKREMGHLVLEPVTWSSLWASRNG